MNYTEEQILCMAPDESSKKAGRDLANPSKWVSKCVNEKAIWGECQGSGSKPYQTQIDIQNIAFKCSCPSHKFPCKHSLGLFLLYARQSANFTSPPMPKWVEDWIEKRNQTEEKKAEKKNKPVDEVAQAKRQEARKSKVESGIEELELWIKDLIRNGIHSVPEKEQSFWTSISKRMIDAQAGGLSAMLKAIADLNFYQEGWQSIFLDQILKLYALIQAYRNLDHLSEPQKAEILARIGFTVNQDELLKQDGIRDKWLVISVQYKEEENLVVERNWLYGTHSQQYALFLQFYVKSQYPSIRLLPNSFIDAELVYFPSVNPLRVLIKNQFGTSSNLSVSGFKDLSELSKYEQNIAIQTPLIENFPAIVENLSPVQYGNQWLLKDESGNSIAIDSQFQKLWNLLAISGGKGVKMALLGKENNYLPLGAWSENKYQLF